MYINDAPKKLFYFFFLNKKLYLVYYAILTFTVMYNIKIIV